ncbi:VOC family protein [Engelhardtia mirabilis]|uniref:Glyoxalase-like domain protein n=1 Tax=Engelhardtia mirabilis TaxID=2528011 RepID=A0A518BQV5_9BACT|nr:Glyoxalase-like domain protein [Planctomycetes bacterium Pla133]QDV03662.1 Glyoxalase-like domain protein [Planctomycetes bacterium Pla86]
MSEDAPNQAPHLHHSIDYLELPVSDMDEAQRFYATAFGWEFNQYGPGYAGIKKPGGEAGGLRLEEQVTRGGPLLVLFSEDLEQSLAGVRAGGGEIVVEPFDFPGGRRFHFLDPCGNELAVWALPD